MLDLKVRIIFDYLDYSIVAPILEKCCAPRYKLKDIEDHKRLAIELVELNKDMDLQIKFVGMNNKILFNTLAL